MGLELFILLLFIFFVGGGLYTGRSIGGFLGNLIDKKEDKPTYIDNSVHHHFHTHEYGDKSFNNHSHLHQNLTVIDEETHQRGLDHFSDKKESRNG